MQSKLTFPGWDGDPSSSSVRWTATRFCSSSTVSHCLKLWIILWQFEQGKARVSQPSPGSSCDVKRDAVVAFDVVEPTGRMPQMVDRDGLDLVAVADAAE